MRHSKLKFSIPGLAIVCILAFGVQAPLAASDDPEKSLHHSAIQEVLAMAEAGVDEEVILLRLEAIPEVPELNGQAIAALKKKGLSRSVLLRLVERGQEPRKSDEPQPARPAPEVADPPVAEPADRRPAPKRVEPADRRPAPKVADKTDSRPTPAVADKADPRPAPRAVPTVARPGEQESTPRIQVDVQARFPIHYAEVLIGDRRVATQGELLEGESEPGFFLSRPRNLLRQGSATLFEGTVAAGTYRVAVGVAHTEILSDPNDEWSEYSRQSYATAVVPATVGAPDPLGSEDPRPVCDVSPGEVCVVTVRVTRSRRAPAGSASRYALDFDTRIVAAQP